MQAGVDEGVKGAVLSAFYYGYAVSQVGLCLGSQPGRSAVRTCPSCLPSSLLDLLGSARLVPLQDQAGEVPPCTPPGATGDPRIPASPLSDLRRSPAAGLRSGMVVSGCSPHLLPSGPWHACSLRAPRPTREPWRRRACAWDWRRCAPRPSPAPRQLLAVRALPRGGPPAQAQLRC
jgi:hypothetical protein